MLEPVYILEAIAYVQVNWNSQAILRLIENGEQKIWKIPGTWC